MSDFKVVGVLAQAGHGKDTCANFLCAEFGLARIGWADALKEDIAEAFSEFPEYSVSAQNSRGRDPRVRRLQQVYGTEWCRDRLGDDYWLRRWSSRAEKARSEGFRGVVIPDVRFPNEFNYVRDVWGGVVVYVYRPGYQEPGVDPTHGSEKYVAELGDRADYTILNAGSLGDFRTYTLAVLGHLFAKGT